MKNLLGTLTLSLLLAGTAYSQTVLVNDTFTSAVRVGTPPSVTGVDRDGAAPLTNDYVVATNGDVPMATGANASNVGPGITGNSFFVTNTSVAYSVSTYFAPTTLQIGQSISLSFDFRTDNVVAANGAGFFRLGLFNSGTGKLTANTSAFDGGGAFADDTGYIAQYSISAGAVSGVLQERLASTGNIFAGGSSLSTTSVGTGPQIAANTNYTATLTLTRTASGVTLGSSFDGVTLTGADTATPFTSFDSLGIFIGTPFGNATTPRNNFIDNVQVNVVPEPTSVALLGLGAGLLCLRNRSRRR